MESGSFLQNNEFTAMRKNVCVDANNTLRSSKHHCSALWWLHEGHESIRVSQQTRKNESSSFMGRASLRSREPPKEDQNEREATQGRESGTLLRVQP